MLQLFPVLLECRHHLAPSTNTYSSRLSMRSGGCTPWRSPDSRSGVAYRAHAARSKLYRIGHAEHNSHIPQEARRALCVACESNAVMITRSLKSLEGIGLEQPNNATFRPGSAQGKGKGRVHAHFSDCFRREAAPSPGTRFARGHGSADRAVTAGAAHSGGIDSRAHARFESHQHRVGRKDWLSAEL